MKYANQTALLQAYAAQAEPHGCTPSGSLFFDGQDLYSYGHHYLLSHLERGFQMKLAYVNSTRYSVTTSCQRAKAIRALLRAGWAIVPTNSPEAIRDGHKGN